VWYGIGLSRPGADVYDCQQCTEKKRDARNCHNRKGRRDNILEKLEWQTASRDIRAIKIGEVKFYRCPISTITRKTWEILKVINATTDVDGNIIIPYVGQSYTDQPEWYKQALNIVTHIRATSRKTEAK
jgi:hypothetical protein